ncbi:MAG: BACON domain-containing protein [Bacteroidales bacterium]|nr:BACON domain-containing protein [Bacteroidales bacterium]
MDTLRILFISLLSVCVVSCKNDPVAQGSISFEGLQDIYVFGPDRQDTNAFVVKSDSPWSIILSDDSDWLTLSPLSGGSGEQTVKMVARANDGVFRRTARFTIYCNAAMSRRTVNLMQEGSAPLCVADKDTLTFDYAGKCTEGDGLIQLTTNGDWALNCDSWISPSSKSGHPGICVLQMAVGEYDGEEDRCGEVVFSSNGGKAVLTVVQKSESDEPVPVEWYDFSKGSVLFGTALAKTNLSLFKELHSKWPEKGWIVSDNAPGVWIEYVQNPENKSLPEQPAFDFEDAQNKCYTVKSVFTGDGPVFHIPVLECSKDATLSIDMGVNITGTAPLCYMVEFSIDGGQNWTPAETGQSTIQSKNLKADSNFHFSAKGTTKLYIKCRMPEDISEKEVLVRIRCVDGTSTPNGDVTTPGSSYHFKIGAPSTSDQGLTIYVK